MVRLSTPLVLSSLNSSQVSVRSTFAGPNLISQNNVAMWHSKRIAGFGLMPDSVLLKRGCVIQLER